MMGNRELKKRLRNLDGYAAFLYPGPLYMSTEVYGGL